MNTDNTTQKKCTAEQVGAEMFKLKGVVATQRLLIDSMLKRSKKTNDSLKQLVRVTQVLGVSVIFLILLFLAVAGGLI